jgi:LacI family transcriptional regulator
MNIKVSRKMIADAVGVSTSTVGMILSGSGERYNAKTRERVLQTAADLGYQPSINARAMRLKRSLLLGILLYDVNTHLAAGFLQGMQETIEDTDYSPLVFFSKSPEAQARCLVRCHQRQVDGLLVNCVIDPATGNADALVRELEKSRIPAVEVFGHFLPTAPKVNVDNRQAGSIGAQHLIDLGHRRIALLTHSRYHVTNTHFDAWEQSCGYRDTLLAAGLEPIIVGCDLDFDHVTEASILQAGFDALDGLLTHPQAPTAVLCYGDQLAYGLNRACRSKGLDVPAQLSICGNNGLNLSTLANPPLTTTRPPYFEVGRAAAGNLLKLIDGATPADSLIPPVMEIRQSTGRANS